MKPVKPLTDPTFEYVNAARTNIRERFARLGWKPPSETRAPVLPIRKVKQ